MMIDKIYYESLPLIFDNLYYEIKQKRIKFDYIYGIPKGGLPIAVHLSNLLDIPFLSTTIQINQHMNKRILLVDDIADSGKTFKKLIGLLTTNNEYTTAALYVKKSSDFIPNIFINKVDDDIWVVFPWEPENSKYNNTEII